MRREGGLAGDSTRGNLVCAIMARRARHNAGGMRVIESRRLEGNGVVARVTGIVGQQMGRRLANGGRVVVAGHAIARKAWLGVIRLGIGHPSGCAVAICAILCGGVERRMCWWPHNCVLLSGVMAT